MTETPDDRSFIAHTQHWDANRRHAGELRVAPSKNLRTGGPRLPGVAVFKGTRIIASLTEEEATEYANSIIDALELAQSRYPGEGSTAEQTDQGTAPSPHPNFAPPA